MAASMGALTVREDPVIEQKEQIIRDLEDENLSLKQELESLRVGFPDGMKSPRFQEIVVQQVVRHLDYRHQKSLSQDTCRTEME